MRLDLDFGRGLVAHVDLENVSEEQYQQITDYFVPLVNEPKLKSRDAIGRAFVMATKVCPDANHRTSGTTSSTASTSARRSAGTLGHRLINAQPDTGCGEFDEGKEVGVMFFVSCRYGSVMLEL